ncbi:MAG: glutamate--tRNA ligase [Gemmatimonadetes bacterium]|nr:glutamate--tRNA ligase [Gemmatimonadota bacterium]
MAETIRTRFAPSPTGALHLGNARTAALNWLFARHHGGAFVLRLEDTDTERNVAGGEASIRDGLDWLGLDRDEGPDRGGDYGPYRQSERGERYAARAEALLEAGEAFRCFCTPEELETHRARAVERGDPPGRDPRCAERSPGETDALLAEGRRFAVRLRVPSGAIAFEDRLKGRLSIDGDDLGDMVLVRADGRPTYNFAVAVDDLEMRISHVIRGVGHLSNTPKQVLLYRAFEAEPPTFVHIPTVLAPGGGKLSKRAGATGLLEYRDRGFHPDAVLNYLSLLSWSSPDGEEFLGRSALVRGIDIDRIGATDGEIDEEKLTWLSGQHIRALPPQALAAEWARRPDVASLGLDVSDLERAAEVFAERTQLYTDAATELGGVFAPPELSGERAAAVLAADASMAALEAARRVWDETEWTPARLKPALRDVAKATGLAGREFFAPVRVALTGRAHGPDIADVAYALGRERTLSRLATAIDFVQRFREGAG